MRSGRDSLWHGFFSLMARECTLNSYRTNSGSVAATALEVDGPYEMAQPSQPDAPANWAAAEHLAYASLLTEGHPVRLSGQDCRRGTFSHRHAVLTDGNTGVTYTPLAHVAGDQASFHCYNSPLSEFAVLGFEFGYSLDRPEALVIDFHLDLDLHNLRDDLHCVTY